MTPVRKMLRKIGWNPVRRRGAERVLPLSEARSGQLACVVALEGGKHMRGRLLSMGLKRGSDLRILRGGNGVQGPTLVAAGETRMAIGYGMARRILVKVR